MKNFTCVTESFVELRGSKMRVLQAGEGPTVLLGHSYLWNADAWAPQIHALARSYRLVMPDLWGHGGSGPLPVGTTSIRDVADHHLELLDALGIERFSIVGHSIGGMWGAELALMAPDRVDAIALIGTYLGAEPVPTRTRFMAMLGAAEIDGALPPGMAQALVPLFFHPESVSTRSDVVLAFLQRLVTWPRTRLLDSIIPLGRLFVQRRNALPDLQFLLMPAIVMTGIRDASRPVSEGRAMAEAIGCEFIEIPDAGHMSPVEAPDFFNSNLLSFLDGVGRTDGREARSDWPKLSIWEYYP